MHRRFVFSAASCVAGVVGFLLGVAPLVAQDEARESGRGGSFWKAELADGVFLVPHAAIASMSRSSYLVDGAVRVTEVSVGTLGSVQGRFYYAEAVEPTSPLGIGQSTLNLIQDRAREAQSRLGADELNTKVLKNYPATTHAHTVEFRLAELSQLEALYESLERSYIRRRTETYSVKDPG